MPESTVLLAGAGRVGSWVLLAYRLPREPSKGKERPSDVMPNSSDDDSDSGQARRDD